MYKPPIIHIISDYELRTQKSALRAKSCVVLKCLPFNIHWCSRVKFCIMYFLSIKTSPLLRKGFQQKNCWDTVLMQRIYGTFLPLLYELSIDLLKGIRLFYIVSLYCLLAYAKYERAFWISLTSNTRARCCISRFDTRRQFST